MNGPACRYQPKKMDLPIYSQEQLDVAADQTNDGPKKGLAVRIPSLSTARC